MSLDKRPSTAQIFRFDKPLAPGAHARIWVRLTTLAPGLSRRFTRDRRDRKRHLPQQFRFAPLIGMNRQRCSATAPSAAARACRPSCGRRSSRTCRATARNYIGSGLDHVGHHLISTDAGPDADRARQPGLRHDGERPPHRAFRRDAPILNFFSIQSARYRAASTRLTTVSSSPSITTRRTTGTSTRCCTR